MKQKRIAHIDTIFANSGNGKTTLSKEITKDCKFPYLYIDCKTMLSDISLDEHINKHVFLRGRPDVLCYKIRTADPRVKEVTLTNLDSDGKVTELSAFEAELYDGTIIPFNKVSNNYQAILTLILLIRNRKNVIIDNFDALNVGNGFSDIMEIIINEINLNGINAVVTFTNISQWQLFSLSIPKEMSKTFYMSRYNVKENVFEHDSIDYVKLAFSVNYIFDKAMKKALEEDDRVVRQSDFVQ